MQRHTVRVTAGIVVEQDDRILIVREPLPQFDPSKIFLTHPSGHMEKRESVLDAAVRECLEETGYETELTDLIGVYETNHKSADYIRFSFVARLKSESPIAEPTDEDVMEVLWMPIQELKARRQEWRPGATTRTLDDYFAGKRYPLHLIGQVGKVDIS
jgi:ADP-ribose pyrophosphatase YjhB (NUDIX family)